jgi:AcrR family transcriptional regulator
MPSSRPLSRSRASPPPRVRLAPGDRRRQLVEVAGRLLTDHGLEQVQIKEVAALAGVTRPVVYRFFPTRKELVLAILDDFATEVDARLRDALLRTLGADLSIVTRAMFEACCDTIDVRGAGPWRLLHPGGATDPEVAELARAIHDRLLSPWQPRIAETTGLAPDHVRRLARILLAAGRAALDEWLDGHATRPEAITEATRAITALLREFAQPASQPHDSGATPTD